MRVLVPDQDMTRDGDLANWQAFCLAYYEPILRALKILRVPAGEVDELAHSFLLKAAEKRFLDAFKVFQEREAEAGRHARFRTYLYRSLQNHVRDFHRKQNTGIHRQNLDSESAEELVARPEPVRDPDALYALDILHQALQALRRHCERTGKPHLWTFFEETLLANEFRGRQGKTRAELLAAYPGADPQFLVNSLMTAKRAFRRFVQDVIPRGLREDVTPSERFAEWMAILRDSHSSQFNLLHLAFRVVPSISADMSEASSSVLIVDDMPTSECYEEPTLVPSDDELSILLSFRMELPLIEMLDIAEVQRFIPPTSPLWPFQIQHGQKQQSPITSVARPTRPFCLMSLIEPSPAEAQGAATADLLGLLVRLKSLSKQIRRRPDHSMPEVFSQLLYTVVNVLAMIRCQAELHTIGVDSLAGNVRWFLKQTWLDDRIRPLFDAALVFLESQHGTGPAVARRSNTITRTQLFDQT